ncbi:2-oxoisovalerate dehydrogenase E1 subunit beta [Methanospirillum stamsii]|uniref:2-oxoisovalerate dehydrogenase n=1 Tax=Methanospirillum stamsii TaxID=1277351 RepID=A0A2V2NJV0_9EURY|nr:2-oxoisovalerate dehydrogenase [Methanospirillum stamsii]PWR75891.1 2-oxoisovalerate dehydrogenase [Methanospirillum stamsii]
MIVVHPQNTKILFLVEEAEEGGNSTRSIGHSYTLVDSVDEIREMVKDAVNCHFDDNNYSPMIRY